MVITEDNELLFSVLFERDFLPQDAEALLGFKPNNGRRVCVSDTCVSDHYMGTQSIDAIERTFGTLILNTLAGAPNYQIAQLCHSLQTRNAQHSTRRILLHDKARLAERLGA